MKPARDKKKQLNGKEGIASMKAAWAGQDSSVGRAVDCHGTGPGFNTHSKPGWGLTQPSIPLWVGKMEYQQKYRVGQHLH